MPLEKTAPEAVQEMLTALPEGGFRFACHPGVPCFTECCRELNLMLTPYDIVRLKNHLGLEAGAFLEEYTEKRFDEQRHLPMIYLKMTDTPRKVCPFVAPEGCQLYADRPAACRIYPLARASRMHRVHGTVQEDYFVLHESHCQGFAEDRSWSLEEWTQDQGLEEYHELNNLWMEVITHPLLRQGLRLSSQQQQMFLLACYNVDNFRKFILAGRFLQLFELDPQEVEALRHSDAALLRLAFKWLRFSLFNDPSLKLCQAG
jgi:Fe-S-cluster containining protein